MSEEKRIKIADLQLGDIIRLDGTEGYKDCTVHKIEGRDVHVTRPYVHTADFTYTGGVITYLGEEKFSLYANDSGTVVLLARRDPEETRRKIRAIVHDIRADLELGKISAALEKLRQL